MRRLLLGLALLLPAALVAQDTGWIIESFDVEYHVNADRTIDVTERIAVDFGELQRHGIYRDIPVRYRRMAPVGVMLPAGTVRVDLELLGVTNDAGDALETKTEGGDSKNIRIGSADTFVTGKQVYIIRYTLEAGGIGFFEHHDELYWQVTGTEWPVPILSASARVLLPNGADATDTAWTAWCYAGWAESNSNERCTATVVPNVEHRFSSGRLEPGEGLTLVAGFPKGIVPSPTAAEIRMARIALWWPLVLPILFFAGLWWVWYTRGREPHVGSIVPQWKVPEGMRPGTAGTLRDQSADMDDIVATLLDLAVRGYITIREVNPAGVLGDTSPDSFIGKALRSIGIVKTDWEITRTRQSDGDLLGYERLVLDGVLEGSSARRMSDLHNDFYKHLSEITTQLYAQVVAQRWFASNPRSVRHAWVALGFFLILVSIGGAVVLQNAVLAVCGALSGVIMMGFAPAMPVMTADGARHWAVVKGLEEYIRRAEKYELEMTQAPKRTTELFSQLLPYAVALDATDIWVDQFAAALASNPPTWYVGIHPGHFDIGGFRSGVTGFSTAATKTMGSAPGSSSGGGGGGSVGGGGGGGGGGSW
jgi:uncharacterized membrane protein YgcG